jgi:hypothetical protein
VRGGVEDETEEGQDPIYERETEGGGDDGLRRAGNNGRRGVGLAESNGTGWGFHERCCWGLMGRRLLGCVAGPKPKGRGPRPSEGVCFGSCRRD